MLQRVAGEDLEPADRPARGWLQREREDARIWRSMLVQAEAGDGSRPPFSKIASLVRFLPGPGWAERYGGGWDEIDKLLTSSRARRGGDAGCELVGRRLRRLALLSAEVSSWWMVGVTPQVGLVALAVRVGLVKNPRLRW